MPRVLHPAVLAKSYELTRKKIEQREIPTTVVQAGQFLYRSINPSNPHTHLPKPAGPRKHISKPSANALLAPADEAMELGNRFSGPSHNAHIRGAGGLYCVQQQQALMNESMHYSKKNGAWALAGRCVLKIRVLGAILVADLSPHNPAGERFLRELSKSAMWEKMNDPHDCSVARGIGLAIAHSGYLRGLSVQTVRESERSSEERGDNLVLYGAPGKAIPGVTVEEAWYFSGKTNDFEIYEVAFP